MNDPGFVHRYLPPCEDSPRTLLLLHGAGGDENDLLALGAELDPKAGLLAPRGKAMEQGAPRFFQRLSEGTLEETDLRFRALELAEFVAWAAQEYGFDASHVVAVGYASGANVGAALLLLSPPTLAGGALLHATVPLTPDESPDLSGKRIFLSAGENDPFVAPEEAVRLHRMLSRYGAETHLAWFPSGREISSEETRAVAAWIGEL